jgi:hypothetical protein
MAANIEAAYSNDYVAHSHLVFHLNHRFILRLFNIEDIGNFVFVVDFVTKLSAVAEKQLDSMLSRDLLCIKWCGRAIKASNNALSCSTSDLRQSVNKEGFQVQLY